MLTTAFARSAYAEAGRAQDSPRRTEYQAFARMTRRLSAAIAAREGAGDGPAGFSELAAAALDNLRLWTVLAADLSQPGNALPEALRGQLLSLAAFTAGQTERILAGQADGRVLVDINTAIMRGLRGETASGEDA
ncbi:MAG: hypothetical protein KatS3mg118_3437 [Paracoccaceae bacterium]|nr:MAG: hypothetical protein KatS3mg118_3437 [Paracoccaceae bacterium]